MVRISYFSHWYIYTSAKLTRSILNYYLNLISRLSTSMEKKMYSQMLSAEYISTKSDQKQGRKRIWMNWGYYAVNVTNDGNMPFKTEDDKQQNKCEKKNNNSSYAIHVPLLARQSTFSYHMPTIPNMGARLVFWRREIPCEHLLAFVWELHPKYERSWKLH